MPSFQIHLAVAKRYMEKHEIKDKDLFVEGSLAPDFVRPKEKSHYTIDTTSEELIEKMESKVSLDHYLAENEVKTDYDKGIFLHLLTDKIFFTEFFDHEMLKKTYYQEVMDDLYMSYESTNAYLREKYAMIIPKALAEKIKQDIEKSNIEKNVKLKNGKQIIAIDKLDAFIEHVSDIDLDIYLQNKNNTKAQREKC